MSAPGVTVAQAASTVLALSCGVMFWACCRLAVTRRPSAAARSGLPIWIRALLPVAAGPGRWLSPALPHVWVEGQARRILRCDLDLGLSVEEWIGLRMVVFGLCGVVLVPLGARAGLPPGMVGALVFPFGWIATGGWLKRVAARRARLVLKELPLYLDIVTLCVESGATLPAALRVAVDKSPRSPLRDVFERVLREIRLGRSRVDALVSVARLYDIECLTALSSALAQSEGAGVSLGGVLRAQSEQRAMERQLWAERCAMQAPVKMLGPLVLCVFPCTFIVIAVPVLARIFLGAGG